MCKNSSQGLEDLKLISINHFAKIREVYWMNQHNFKTENTDEY